MDELNGYLEYTCVRCDDGKCKCCECQHQDLPPVAPIIDDDYIDKLNDWD